MTRYLNLMRNISNWSLYLGIKFGLTRPDPIHFITRSGVTVEVPRRLLQTFKEVFMDECYMDCLQRPIPKGGSVIDIGANAGFFSMFAASRFDQPKILSYEPIPVNFRQLEKNRELNPQHDIHPHQNAVAGKAGEITLTFDPSDSFTTSASMTRKQEGEEIKVTCVTLKDIFEKYGLERCDFLKMDCEGAEYDIFYNCPEDILSRIDQIAMEVHKGTEPRHDMDSLEQFFKHHGFLTQRRPVDMLWAWKPE
ncbi:MAG: FkbM family methyltransferase [Nitrospinota bacterium]|nr:FkbM family methyltransferase [Nitrospinota bacterium]